MRLKTPTLKLEGRLNLEMEPLHSNLKIKEINVSDKRMAGWSARVEEPDPIALLEVGEHSFWVHAMGHLEKPLATRVGVAGHVTSREE